MIHRLCHPLITIAFIALLSIHFTGCEKTEPPAEREETPAATEPEEQTTEVRRKEKTAYRQVIRGQIKGKGKNASWASMPEAARVDFQKSSFNTYTYNAVVDVYIHKNDGERLDVDYHFSDISVMELVSDREISFSIRSGWLPPGLPTRITLKEEYIQFIENRVEELELEEKLPPRIGDLIEYGGSFLAFRSPNLDELQDTALGLKGKTVNVRKSLGSSIVKGRDFEVTPQQREFINRFSLTADIEIFPEDKSPGDIWQAQSASLSFVFDPLMPGEFRGPIDIEYLEKLQDGDQQKAMLKIRRAQIDFISNDATSRGSFDGFGDVNCLLPARLITTVDLKGGGEFRGFPQKHLLYGMQYEGQPQFEAIANTETIPYQETP